MEDTPSDGRLVAQRWAQNVMNLLPSFRLAGSEACKQVMTKYISLVLIIESLPLDGAISDDDSTTACATRFIHWDEYENHDGETRCTGRFIKLDARDRIMYVMPSERQDVSEMVRAERLRFLIPSTRARVVSTTGANCPTMPTEVLTIRAFHDFHSEDGMCCICLKRLCETTDETDGDHGKWSHCRLCSLRKHATCEERLAGPITAASWQGRNGILESAMLNAACGGEVRSDANARCLRSVFETLASYEPAKEVGMMCAWCSALLTLAHEPSLRP